MSAVSQLGYLGIGVSDLGAWEQFATTVLGLAANGHDDDGALYLRMDDYHHRFTLHPGGADDVTYVGWEVKDEDALTAVAARLRAQGVAVSAGTAAHAETRKVAALVTCWDPCGIATEIFCGPLTTFEQPFRSPKAMDGGFVAGGQGLGHIVISGAPMDEALRFYRDGLGMKVSDFVERQGPDGAKTALPFFHCNPRHHSVAVAGAPRAKRLAHFMLQLTSLNDVGATFDHLLDADWPIARGLGRHSNDHMVSFYLKSPSGFEIEYGWGAREVDDATWQIVRHQRGTMWGHRPVTRPAPAPTNGANGAHANGVASNGQAARLSDYGQAMAQPAAAAALPATAEPPAPPPAAPDYGQAVARR